jgi:predicted acetyltransferase
MGEFFIVGKFQGRGVGREVATQLFKRFPGTWEVMQMESNTPAISFWKKVVSDHTAGKFLESKINMPDPKPHENILLKFKIDI